MRPDDPVTVIKGVGEKAAQNLKKMNILTVNDLISHYPDHYLCFESPVPASQVTAEQIQAVEGTFSTAPQMISRGSKIMINCKFRDPSGSIGVRWYNQPYIKNQIHPGARYVLRGRIVWRDRTLTLEQPKLYEPDEYRKLIGMLQPVYPLTDGITNNALSKAIGQAIRTIEPAADYLPARIRKQYALPERAASIRDIHFPTSGETAQEAKKRLIFDEFFLFTLALRQRKEFRSARINHFPMQRRPECLQLITGLPYELTGAQRRVFEELQEDLCGLGIMNRLIQGDVGSGKTILAVLALMMTALNGYQGCLMVPTEVLAKQHYKSLTAQLEPFGLKIEFLTGSLTAAEKKKAQDRIRNHEADIIVGTHALIQEKVQYDSLGLVVTDEQHRFGVKQRESLAGKSEEPHMLVMSATPIPRTLSILLYGDLDLSVLDELPASRLPIKNCVVGTGYRDKAYRFIAKQAEQGHQAYIICPMVEESDEIEAENVTDYTEQLKEALAGISEQTSKLQVEFLHGRMKPKEKNGIMERFAAGEITILVSTTVIEVGVDVPNATVMMIENAERFGLAQLHQLRGRVGRGSAQSYCIMVSTSEDETTKERLGIMNHSNDGFYIAGEDLKLRGPGDVFGLRQSGEEEFRIGDVFRDARILQEAGEAANGLTDSEREELQSVIPFEKYNVTA